MIDAYFDEIRATLNTSSTVASSNITFDRRADQIGFVRGDVYFADGSHLHFREFVQTRENAPAKRYRYATTIKMPKV